MSSALNQVCAQALRYCMCCLYDQKSVWLLPIVFLSTDRTPPIVAPFPSWDPPDIVFQGETVAVRAQIGHCDSSLSSNWRDDTPQVISTSNHDLLHNAQLFCLILCYSRSKASLILSKVHSEAFTSFLKAFLYSSQSPPFRSVKPF